MTPPFFTGLPSESELQRSPEAAVFAALEAQLVLAIRVLRADPSAPLALALEACATGLHALLLEHGAFVRRRAFTSYNTDDEGEPF